MSPKKPSPEKTEKLQKVLARVGLGSRRTMETWISAGRVSVDGKIVTLGTRVSGQAKIRVDGNLLNTYKTKPKKPRILLYHKPEGEVCTRHDEEGRPTVFDGLPTLRNERWIVVGRLDINTTGVLLFTTDGDLANRLMHPSSNIEREYAVRIYGAITNDTLKKLETGVKLEDGLGKFESIKDAGGSGRNHWYHVIVKQGRNRLVRRLWESQDLTVSRLIRIRFANVTLPRNLKPGYFTDADVDLTP